MKKYLVYPTLVASPLPIEVEADSVEAAIEKAAAEYEQPSLCHHCNEGFELSDEPEFHVVEDEEICHA